MKHNWKMVSGIPVLLGVLLTMGCGNLLLPPAETTESPPTLAQKIRGIWMVGGLSGTTVATAVNQVDL